MLFNSYIFIFGFLPIVLIIYWALQSAGKTQWAMTFLVPASLIFYAYWNPPFVFLLLGSILFNFYSGKYLGSGKPYKKLVLVFAIAVNLGLLAWFKYAALIATTVNQAAGTTMNPDDIFLPLGISFFTFHQITYLIDVYKGKIIPSGFRNYALYVGFFPQLIAGPIVRAWEIIPQFENFTGKEKFWRNMALGSGLFTMGLFKKVVIADSLANCSNLIFSTAQDSEKTLSFFDGWSGALAYTFQLYFDFSGYSDMAIGLGLMMGFVLPLNFLSPYKSTSIIEFWRRWHMTMSRFFRDYLYIPLGGNRVSAGHQILNLIITMFLAGLWHGAAWTFAAWGLLHGFYLIINHVFAALRQKFAPGVNTTWFVYRAAAHIITMLAVAVGWVLFRAENFGAALRMLKAMAGFNGIIMPRRPYQWLEGLGLVQWLESLGMEGFLRLPDNGEKWIAASYYAIPMIIAAYLLCITMPASVEYFGLTENRSRHRFALNGRTAFCFALMAILALISMQRISEFLYFQF